MYKTLLHLLKPELVVEWGRGPSTTAALDRGARVHSIVHEPRLLPDAAAYERARGRHSCLLSPPDAPAYLHLGPWREADLFFVDGRRRSDCLRALADQARPDAIVCLHDAQRPRYHEALEAFHYVRFVGEGVAIATQSRSAFQRLRDLWTPQPPPPLPPEGLELPVLEQPRSVSVCPGLTAQLDPQRGVDVCYIYRPSRWGEELRYSLRSLERHFPDLGQVWVVGHLPPYLDPETVRHVPYAHPVVPEIDLFKRLHANRQPGLSPDYLRFCDDYVLLRDVGLADFKPFALQDLTQVKHRGSRLWQKLLWRTFDAVRARGLHGYNFESHTPKVYNRQRFEAVMAAFRPDWAGAVRRHDDLCSDTVYFNTVLDGQIPPEAGSARIGLVEPIEGASELEARLEEGTFLFFDDAGLNETLKRHLVERFPQPSRFERGGQA